MVSLSSALASCEDINKGSLSSVLMCENTLVRNLPGGAVVGQVGYAVVAVAALVESAAAAAASVLSAPISRPLFERSVEWLSSSSFTVVWSVTDFFLNPFLTPLVADEQSARMMASSGDLLHIPFGARY